MRANDSPGNVSRAILRDFSQPDVANTSRMRTTISRGQLAATVKGSLKCVDTS